MGYSLYIRKRVATSGAESFQLEERRHDLSGVDYEPLCKLTRKQAAGLMSFAPWCGSNVYYQDLHHPDLVMDKARIEDVMECDRSDMPYRVIFGTAEPLYCGTVLAEIFHKEAKVPYEEKVSLEERNALLHLYEKRNRLQQRRAEIEAEFDQNELEIERLEPDILNRKEAEVELAPA